MLSSKLVGKTVARVIQRRCPEPGNSRHHKVHELEAPVFTDRTVLRFTVLEHDDSGYGIEPIYPGRAVPALRGEE